MLDVLIKLKNKLHNANCKKEIVQNIMFITNRTNHNTKTSCYASATKHLGIGLSVGNTKKFGHIGWATVETMKRG